MLAVVTGASSGIGKDISKELAIRGFDLVLVSRDEEKLEELSDVLPVKTKIIPMDLSKRENAKKLYDMLECETVDVLVNNAGFGEYGFFADTDIQKDFNMINLNICAMHYLTKLFLKGFLKKDHGFILNVSSFASFMPGGPLMSTYYATKSYVSSLSKSIYEEIRRRDSKVSISVLCPGPVSTGFNERAGVKFAMHSLTSREVAAYAVKKMFEKKLIIVPGVGMKVSKSLSRFTSEKTLLKICYRIQKAKND